tara:strand:- start:40 stop:219 length:180 start_codon:yes stop_codon:yes gene_type:complete
MLGKKYSQPQEFDTRSYEERIKLLKEFDIEALKEAMRQVELSLSNSLDIKKILDTKVYL